MWDGLWILKLSCGQRLSVCHLVRPKCTAARTAVKQDQFKPKKHARLSKHSTKISFSSLKHICVRELYKVGETVWFRKSKKNVGFSIYSIKPLLTRIFHNTKFGLWCSQHRIGHLKINTDISFNTVTLDNFYQRNSPTLAVCAGEETATL